MDVAPISLIPNSIYSFPEVVVQGGIWLLIPIMKELKTQVDRYLWSELRQHNTPSTWGELYSLNITLIMQAHLEASHNSKLK